MALAWGAASPGIFANPLGGVVIQGQAQFDTTQANRLLVTTQNAPGTQQSAINWQSFSIPAGSSTYFQQPSANSTSINRVVTNTPSQLLGTLGSNGSLVLVNQSGIAVGAGAVVDTAGFTASALQVTDADVLSGAMRFGTLGVSGGDVSVSGNVLARSGDVVLVGKNVSTSKDAFIQAPGGAIVLGAGSAVSISSRGLNGIQFEVQAPENSGVNLGTLQGDAVGIFAGTLKHSGLVQAATATLEGGKVVLKAKGDAFVEGAGKIVATGVQGGTVDVLGKRVALTDEASIDVSGSSGGGLVRVGGDYQGKNPDIQNAQMTHFASDASIKADSTGSGNGGRVIIWADDTTRAFGNISARGGAVAGDGGFVETSGKNTLSVTGARVNTLAAQGKTGTWLLDPGDITITHGTQPVNVLSGSTSLPALTDYDINAALSSSNLIIATSGGTGGSGDITFDSASGGAITIASSSAPATLTLNADNNIVFSGAGGTTFRAAGSTPTLDVYLNTPSGKTRIDAGSVTLDGTPGAKVRAIVSAGRDWDNHATLNINGNAEVKLGTSSRLNNKSSGIVNAAASGFAFSSNPSSDDGIVVNDGVLNVTADTAFEAEFNQSSTGSLNINGSSLNLQNGKSISGTIDLAPTGATIPGTLNVNEYHGNTAAFSNVTINKTAAAVTNQVSVNIGGTVGAVTASFANVSASNVVLNVGASQAGSASITGGSTSTFYDVSKGAYGNLAINNGTLSIAKADYQNPYSVPAGVTYSGNVGYVSAGGLTLVQPISTSGNVSLTSEYDMTLQGNISAGGTLNLTATSGSILQSSGVITATGLTTVNAAYGITLNQSANDFSSITSTNSNSGTTEIRDTNALVLDNILGRGGVTIVAGGSITQPSGAMDTRASQWGSAGAVSVTGSSVSLGNIFANGKVDCSEGCFDGGAGGTVTVRATSGDVSVGAITSAGGDGSTNNGVGTNGGSSGNVSLIASGGVSLNGINVQGGRGGVGSTSTGAVGALGRWLVYAANPDVVSKGGLTSNFRHYNATYSNYATPSESGNGFIYASTPGTVTVNSVLSGGSTTSTYGVAPNASYTTSLSGIFDAEDISGIAAFGPAITSTTAVGSYKVGYTGGLNSVTSYSGNGAGNPVSYSLVPGSSATYSVTPASLSMGNLTGSVTKVYDGNLVATLAPSNFVITGFIPGEGATVNQTVGAYANKNAGTGVGVTVSLASSNFSPTGQTNLANYILPTSASGNIGIITQLGISSVAGLTAENKVYDATTAARVVTSGAKLSGVLANDAVSVATANGAFADKNVGTGKTVGITGLTLAGTDATNYILTNTTSTATADITPKALSVSAVTAANKVYDGTTMASLSGGVLSGAIAGDNLVLGTPVGNFSDKNVGTGKTVGITGLTLGGTDAGNYLLGPVTTSTLADITPKTLTVSGITVANKVYDGKLDATPKTSTAVFNGLVSGDSLSIASVKGTFADKNVGAGKVVNLTGLTFAGSDAGNYTPPQDTKTSADISVRPTSNWSGAVSNSWNDAGNWDALPDGANVLAVNIGTGSGIVAFDGASVSLQSLNSTLPIAIGSGSMQVSGTFTAGGFNQTGGTVSGVGSFTVNGAMNQSGGSVAMGSVTATQGSGTLTVNNLKAATVNLSAGSISQTATGGIEAATLTTNTTGGTVLTGSGNKIGTWNATNSGAGAVRLINTGLINVTAINGGGDLGIESFGGVVTQGQVKTSGAISITANSPLTVGAAGLAAGGNIVLTATNLTSAGDILLNGPVETSAGSVAINAANNLEQNSSVKAPLGVSAQAGGTLKLGPLATTGFQPVTYLAAAGQVAPPPPPSALTVANDLVVAMMVTSPAMDTPAARQVQVAANIPVPDKEKEKDTSKEPVVTEGGICRP